MPSNSTGFCVAIDDERARDQVRRAVDGDLSLLHHLEQRRLRLRRGPVDLVADDDVGEHRARAELELVGVRVVDLRRRSRPTGSRSGVNWMRFIDPSIELAIALASDVLPVPGTSSSSRWPSAIMQTSAIRTTDVLPRMNVSTFCLHLREALGEPGGPRRGGVVGALLARGLGRWRGRRGRMRAAPVAHG